MVAPNQSLQPTARSGRHVEGVLARRWSLLSPFVRRQRVSAVDELSAIYDAMRCLVSGLQLDFKPWDGESASDEICPQRGMQFGYYDGGPDDRRVFYDRWGAYWRSGTTSDAGPNSAADGGGGSSA